MSFVLSAISVATFAVAGLVGWYRAIIMMVASTFGGDVRAPLARATPIRLLRLPIALVGLGMSVVFFAGLFTG